MDIEYSAFKTLEEQLKDYEVLNLDLFEKLKDNIIMLYLHDVLTDSQKDVAFNRLHRKLMKNIKGLRKEEK